MGYRGPLEPSIPTLHRVKCELQGYKIGDRRDLRTSMIPRNMRHAYNGGRGGVLADFLDFTNLISDANPFARHDLAMCESIGPVSWTVPWDVSVAGKPSMKEGLNRFFEPHVWGVDLTSEAAKYATGIVRGLISVSGGKIYPIPLKEAIFLFKGKHGFGYPFFSSDSELCFYPAYELSYQLLRSLDLSFALHHLALLGTRSVSRAPCMPGKSRVIYQCARVTNNVAKTLFQPLFDRLKLHPGFAALGGTRVVDFIMPRMMSHSRGLPCLSADFSNFDASVPPQLINVIFEIIKGWFVKEAHPLVNLVRDEFNGCGIIAPGASDSPDLSVLLGRCGGVPSGHVLTNLVDSLVNLWSMAYAAFCNGCRLRSFQVQGDDGVYYFDGDWDVRSLSATLLKDCGLTLHPEKSLVSDTEVYFCSNYHRLDWMGGRGVRLFAKVLANAFSRERSVDKSVEYELDTLRWLQQWDEARFHPCHERASIWLGEKLGQPIDVSALIATLGGPLVAARAFVGGANDRNLEMLDRLQSSDTAAVIRKYT